MGRVIVVCGPSGSGKTTLADALARELRIACLHKDSVKAILHDRLGLVTPDSYLVFHALAEEQVALGVDLIVEATFEFEEGADVLRRWQQRYGGEIVVLVCEVGRTERRRRLQGRIRHPVHAAADRRVLEHLDSAPPSAASALPGEHVVIRTDRPVEACVSEIRAHLRA